MSLNTMNDEPKPEYKCAEEHQKSPQREIVVSPQLPDATCKTDSRQTGRKYYCKYCNEHFRSQSDINDHLKTAIECEYSCHRCGKVFSRKLFLIHHITGGHNSSPHFKCRVCHTLFLPKSDCNTQDRTHIGKDLLEWIYCNKCFTQFVIIQTDAKKRFKCKVCSRSFARTSVLTECIRYHTGEKPFRCRFCSKSFARKIALTECIRSHTGEKPYKCHVCDKSFSVRPSLLEHMASHPEEKLYKCNFCKEGFSLM